MADDEEEIVVVEEDEEKDHHRLVSSAGAGAGPSSRPPPLIPNRHRGASAPRSRPTPPPPSPHALPPRPMASEEVDSFRSYLDECNSKASRHAKDPGPHLPLFQQLKFAAASSIRRNRLPLPSLRSLTQQHPFFLPHSPYLMQHEGPWGGMALRDLVCGNIEAAFVVSFDLSSSFLLSECPDLFDARHLSIVTGHSNIERDGVFAFLRQNHPGATVYHTRKGGDGGPKPVKGDGKGPILSNHYGSFHPKALLLFYEGQGLRVLITSGNLIPRRYNEVVFWQDFPLRAPPAAPSPSPSILGDFGRDLLHSLEDYNLSPPDLTRLRAIFERVDFSSARGKVIATSACVKDDARFHMPKNWNTSTKSGSNDRSNGAGGEEGGGGAGAGRSLLGTGKGGSPGTDSSRPAKKARVESGSTFSEEEEEGGAGPGPSGSSKGARELGAGAGQGGSLGSSGRYGPPSARGPLALDLALKGEQRWLVETGQAGKGRDVVGWTLGHSFSLLVSSIGSNVRKLLTDTLLPAFTGRYKSGAPLPRALESSLFPPPSVAARAPLPPANALTTPALVPAPLQVVWMTKQQALQRLMSAGSTFGNDESIRLLRELNLLRCLGHSSPASGGWERLISHAKVFLRTDRAENVLWCYVGSANLSSAAWGQANLKEGRGVAPHLEQSGSSFELGFLLLPSLETSYRASRAFGFVINPYKGLEAEEQEELEEVVVVEEEEEEEKGGEGEREGRAEGGAGAGPLRGGEPPTGAGSSDLVIYRAVTLAMLRARAMGNRGIMPEVEAEGSGEEEDDEEEEAPERPRRKIVYLPVPFSVPPKCSNDPDPEWFCDSMRGEILTVQHYM